MSVTLNIVVIGEDAIEQLVDAPHLLHGVFDESLRTADDGTELVVGPIANIDKTWHALHFLLTNTEFEGDPPLCYLVRGGEEIPDSDDGYGPARVIRPDETRAFAEAFDAIPPEEIERRYDPETLNANDIYPTGSWTRGPDSVEYLLQHYNRLRQIVAQAAKTDRGLLMMMT